MNRVIVSSGNAQENDSSLKQKVCCEKMKENDTNHFKVVITCDILFGLMPNLLYRGKYQYFVYTKRAITPKYVCIKISKESPI